MPIAQAVQLQMVRDAPYADQPFHALAKPPPDLTVIVSRSSAVGTRL